MTTAIITSKGRITLPSEVRQALQLKPGDRIEFFEVAPGRFELRAVTCSVAALKGMFGKRAKAVDIEDMNNAIAQHGAAAR